MKNKKIYLSEPFLNKDDFTLLKKSIQEGWVSTAGNYINEFENKIAKYTGCKYAIATINGTTALQISIKLAGVMPKDEVIVPTLTYIATVNSIVYCGASPIFMDVESNLNLSIKKVIKFLIEETITKHLDKDINLEKTDKLLKIILFSAVFELIFKHNTPKNVVISEYVKASEFFLEKSQISYLNAILDKLSKLIRKE